MKFGADATHGQRVGRVATLLLTQLQTASMALEPLASERLHRKLKWAATLHEIGSHISHSDYHKHGAYILDQSDALGFTQSELHKLSLLVLGHRGKLRKLEADFTDIPFVQQLLALRLAVILCHARREPFTDGLCLSTPRKTSKTFELQYAQGWDRAFPQSAHLLREEVLAWQKTPWALELREQTSVA
jgi:exopolyphosphatase/guanosine-5'-triphosphate,3'-diphosphate pyrophosphatase